MATVAVLDTVLRARTEKFNRGMKGARRQVSTFGNAVAIAKAKLAAFSLVAGGIVVAALTVMVKNLFQSLDAVGKMSDRVGIATEKLIGLQLAAKITGAGAEALNKGLSFLAKALGEASTGIGEAKDALKLLGLSVEDLLSLSPDEQFIAIAEASKQLATAEQEAFVASKLFGRGGLALVNTLRLGRDGIQEMLDKVIELGTGLDRAGTQKIQAANDAITLLMETITGAVTKELPAIAVAVKDVADALSFIVTNAGAAKKALDLVVLVARGDIFALLNEQNKAFGFGDASPIRLAEIVSGRTREGIKARAQPKPKPKDELAPRAPFIPEGPRFKPLERTSISDLVDALKGETTTGAVRPKQAEVKFALKGLESEFVKAREASAAFVGKRAAPTPSPIQASLREITSRFDVAGLPGKKAQQVTVPQLQTTNTHLANIEAKITGGLT